MKKANPPDTQVGFHLDPRTPEGDGGHGHDQQVLPKVIHQEQTRKVDAVLHLGAYYSVRWGASSDRSRSQRRNYVPQTQLWVRRASRGLKTHIVTISSTVEARVIHALKEIIRCQIALDCAPAAGGRALPYEAGRVLENRRNASGLGELASFPSSRKTAFVQGFEWKEWLVNQSTVLEYSKPIPIRNQPKESMVVGMALEWIFAKMKR